MKKFYSLALAAAVAAGSLSASSAEFANKKAAMVADAPVATTTTKSTTITASYLKEHGTLSQRADRNLVGDYFLSCESPSGADVFEPFTIEAGSEANTYVIKNFFWGEDAKPLQAQYIAGDIDGTFYEFLVIPSGQHWFDNNGYPCSLYCGYATSQGTMGIYNDGQGGYANLEFMLEEEDGDLIWTGDWANAGQIPALIWLFTEGPNKDRGNAFTNPNLYLANGVFSANAFVSTDQTTGQPVFEPMTAPVYAAGYKQMGANHLEITGLADNWNVYNPLDMTIAANGEATASNVVAGSFYTDNTHTETFDAYFWNGEPTDAAATVSALLTEADGKATITFADNCLFVAAQENNRWAWMTGWTNPTVVINRTFGYVAGVENIAADVEDLNAPVEYYNLQGIRVAQPEAGQLLIQRQGNKATKVVIR